MPEEAGPYPYILTEKPDSPEDKKLAKQVRAALNNHVRAEAKALEKKAIPLSRQLKACIKDLKE